MILENRRKERKEKKNVEQTLEQNIFIAERYYEKDSLKH